MIAKGFNYFFSHQCTLCQETSDVMLNACGQILDVRLCASDEFCVGRMEGVDGLLFSYLLLSYFPYYKSLSLE